MLSLLGLLPSMVATTQCRQGIDEMISVAIGMVLAQFPAAMYAIAATAWRRGVKYGAILALGVAMPFVFAAWMFSGLCG